MADLVPANDSRIRLIHIDDGVLIGDKRNFGCERAAGEIIAHFDDDDYSAPGRLSDQLDRMLSTGKAVTGYRSMRFTDGARWWRYEGTAMFALGTSLCYRREWWVDHRFKSVQVGEDNEFVRQAADAGQLAVAEAGELMYATIHLGNTSPRSMGGNSWIVLAA